jgi:hypothetical protein
MMPVTTTAAAVTMDGGAASTKVRPLWLLQAVGIAVSTSRAYP